MIYTLVIGFVIGVVAKLLTPGKGPGGCIVTIVIGIVGSWLGQFIFSSLGMTRPIGFIGSVVGAVILLLVLRAIAGRPRS